MPTMKLLEELQHKVRFTDIEQRQEYFDFSIWSAMEIQEQLFLFYKEGLSLYPWKFTVKDSYPGLGIAYLSLYLQPLQLTLEYWVDIDTLIALGAQNIQGGSVWPTIAYQDTVIMAFREVRTEYGWPEASMWVDYLYSCHYGTWFTTEHTKWRQALIQDGLHQCKVLPKQRYYTLCDAVTRAQAKHNINKETLTKLSKRL